MILNYGQFDVTILHSKVSDAMLDSEIQGEAGSLVVNRIAECQSVTFIPREGDKQNLSQPQHINTMLYEAQTFVRLVEQRHVSHPALEISRSVARLLTEIRRQTGVVFPADRP